MRRSGRAFALSLLTPTDIGEDTRENRIGGQKMCCGMARIETTVTVVEGMMHWHNGNKSCEGGGYFSISFDIDVDADGLGALFTDEKDRMKVHIIQELIGAEYGSRQMVKVFPSWKNGGALIITHGLHWNNSTTGKFQNFEIVGGSNHNKTKLAIILKYLNAKENGEPVGLGALFG